MLSPVLSPIGIKIGPSGTRSLDRPFHPTRRKSGEILKTLMLIRCLSCETGAHFVSIVALNLKKLRIPRRMRLECSSETLLIGPPLITRRPQVQVLSPQPQDPRTATVLGSFYAFKAQEIIPIPSMYRN